MFRAAIVLDVGTAEITPMQGCQDGVSFPLMARRPDEQKRLLRQCSCRN